MLFEDLTACIYCMLVKHVSLVSNLDPLMFISEQLLLYIYFEIYLANRIAKLAVEIVPFKNIIRYVYHMLFYIACRLMCLFNFLLRSPAIIVWSVSLRNKLKCLSRRT